MDSFSSWFFSKNNRLCKSINCSISGSIEYWNIFAWFPFETLPSTELSVISFSPPNSSTKLFPQIILQSRLGSCRGLVCSSNSPLDVDSTNSSSITIDSHSLNLAISTALGSISHAKIQLRIVSTFKL